MKISFLSIVFALFMVGCAQIPEPPVETADWAAHQQQLETLTHWTLSGKVAVITPEKRHSLNIYWQQNGDDFHITLTSFLGATILDIKKTTTGTTITDDSGKVYFGQNSQELIRQLSGLTLPVDVLQQWIKGNPTNAIYLLDENNQLVSLTGQDSENDNWSVDYSDYKTIQQISLPHRLQLNRHNLLIKFAIQKWLLSLP
ncbi:lipoprotein insertase outer membrane protein LolB [Psychromonas sp.]|uniref:lipoprotein insertase outer membrane protein LolB n=1 Tax=Psychromonas sp. TaxID=1884585 RepID=UPI00356A2587